MRLSAVVVAFGKAPLLDECVSRLADALARVEGESELILVENKIDLMRKLGRKQLTLQLQEPLPEIPAALSRYTLERSADGSELTYTYDADGDRTRIAGLLKELDDAGVRFKDLQTTQSSLEDIFVSLVKEDR